MFEQFPGQQQEPQENAPDSQRENLQKLSKISAELGFVESETMKELRLDPVVWGEQSRDYIEETAKADDLLRRDLSIAALIEFAMVFYEQGNMEGYLYEIGQAADMAQQVRLFETVRQLEEIERSIKI